MRLCSVALLCLGIAACGSQPESSERRYQHWLEAGHRSQAAGYYSYLRAQGLDRIVPLHGLLRSGRRWRWCGVDEFAVPPRKDWATMKPTLELVADLQAAGFVSNAAVASAGVALPSTAAKEAAVRVATSRTTRWILTSAAASTWGCYARIGAGTASRASSDWASIRLPRSMWTPPGSAPGATIIIVAARSACRLRRVAAERTCTCRWTGQRLGRYVNGSTGLPL